MVVLGYGDDELARVAWVLGEAGRSLDDWPPQVPATTSQWEDVHLFPLLQTHVGHDHRLGVDGEPPRVAQPIGPHLGRTTAIDEGVVLGDRIRKAIGRPAIDIDPGDGGEQGSRVLALRRSVGPVPKRDPEVPVRPEEDHPAVVPDVGAVLRLGEVDEETLRAGVGPATLRVVLGEPPVPRSVDVVDEQPPVLLESGVKGESEQTLFDPVGGDPVADVEERLGDKTFVADDPDGAGALDDEEPAVAARGGCVCGLGEA